MATGEPPQRRRKVEFVKYTSNTTCHGIRARFYCGVDTSELSSSDNEVDPYVQLEYCRQIHESSGFDLDIGLRIPTGSFLPFKLTNEDLHDEIGIYGRVGLHWHNFQKSSNLQLLRLVKYNSSLRGFCAYYITIEAMDPSNDSLFIFQTCVVNNVARKNEDNRIITEVCRIKPKPGGSRKDNWHWNDETIDDFHNEELVWLSDDALTQSGDKQKQYYEVQESDIRENDWLNLYTEFAFHSILERDLTKLKLKSALPLKIKKVVVQTREDVESSKKLKSENAIFYISFSDHGQTEDHRAVVRRVTDGIPGHVSLEVKVRNLV